MKKISNEVKVGVTGLLTIVVFVLLYNYLKGKDLFKSTCNYYSIYENIGGLQESSPVEVNGHKVGVVQSIEFVDAQSGRLLVEFSVRKDFKLPKNTVAQIAPVSVLGGMKVQFVYGTGPGVYSNGDTIPGILKESILDKVETVLVPVKDKITGLVASLDSVLQSVNDILDEDFKKNLNGTLSNLNGATESLDNILGSREKDLKSTLNNLNQFSQMLADNSGNLGKTLNNLGEISDTLAAADLFGSITRLKASLEKASILLENLNKGKGTAGQLITNDSLYINLTNSLQSLDLLLKDVKLNPKKYVHYSLFGKKSAPAN
jgi:phospholipid/cholesterol/gamma-HCH transport system substrate-binding protein